jgi:uncharacterized protein (TIGR02145 family)
MLIFLAMKTLINKLNLFFVFSIMTNVVLSQRIKEVVDIDNNIYHIIKIGKSEWMTENLKTLHYNNGDLIKDEHLIIDNPNPLYSGKYYSWKVVNDSRNICPTGWYVPSDKDWFYMENKLGGEDIAAIDMKSDMKGIWDDFDFDDFNASGFNAYPIGYVTEKGKLSNVGIHAYWWSSTEQNEKQAIGRAIGVNEDNVYKGFATKEDGLAVRCFRYVK